jgi:hypothetical protein
MKNLIIAIALLLSSTAMAHQTAIDNRAIPIVRADQRLEESNRRLLEAQEHRATVESALITTTTLSFIASAIFTLQIIETSEYRPLTLGPAIVFGGVAGASCLSLITYELLFAAKVDRLEENRAAKKTQRDDLFQNYIRY